MAKKIYIGNMLQEMQSAIADLQTDMGTMSTDMASMVAELVAVKETIGQGITSINVEAGTDKEVVFNSADITAHQTVMSTPVQLLELVSLSKGVMTISGSVVSATPTTTFSYKINDGSLVTITTLGAETKAFSINIPLNVADNIKFMITTGYTHIADFQLLAGCNAQYNIVDVVNDGGIVKV